MAEWADYDWNFDDHPARVTVDVSLRSKALEKSFPWLVWIIFSAQKLPEEPGRSDIQRMFKLQSVCLKALTDTVRFVGNVFCSGELSLYFYTSLSEVPRCIQQIAQKEKKLYCECGIKKDPKWSYYNSILYPDAAKLQTIKNADLIGAMKKAGDSIEARRLVVSYIFFPSEPNRLAFEQEARQSGFILGNPLFLQDHEPPHGASLKCLSTLKKSDIDKMTTRIITIASRFGGEYESWTSLLMRGKH